MVEFKLSPHSVLSNRQVVELWYRGEFIGQITSDDGPGVRVISRHRLQSKIDPSTPVASVPNVATIRIGG